MGVRRGVKATLLTLVSLACVVFVSVAAFGLYLTFSGKGSGNIGWTRLAEAPPGAGAMDAESFDARLVRAFIEAPVGEGGLFGAPSYNEFWDDVRAAGGVPTQGDCYAVTVENAALEFCPGAM